MIKLNNKNITYVAFADSSNSIKAPKEIWYADTNNSVKLVYRRKDALIEGEDYEKYHWLKGDGDAVITHKDVNAFEVKVLELDTTGVNYAKGYIVNGGTRFTRLYIGSANSGGNYSGLLIFRDVGVVVANYRSPSLSIELGEHIITKNTQTDQIGVFTDDVRHIKNATSDVDYVGTNIIFNQLVPHQNLYIGYLSSPNIHNLIPCKLLKPIPKWLDANGIRRNIGECGMIDLVSGKFYGNVNSNGTFTVENYYERKEWLQGRNGAYINTMHPLTTYDDAFYVKAHFDGTIKNPKNEEQNIFGYAHLNNNAITDICRLYINSSGRISCNYYIPDGNWDSLPNSLGLTDIEVYSYAVGNNHYVNLNDTLHTLSTNGMQQQTFGSFIALFSNNGDDDNGARLKSRYFHGDIASFRISDPTFTTDKMNLIPCTLTMDLPASMDANNIARTKGTSGMWDLVSDRFYGNVANSGTFKAVNLAEGVDYEVHQWLVGDEAYFRIHINIYQESLYIKFHPTSSDSNKIFWEGFYNISSDATIEIRGIIGGSNELGIRFGIRENGETTAGVLNARNIDFLNDFTIETQYSEDNKVNFIFNGTSGTGTPKIDSRANVNVSVEFKTTWCKFAMVTTDRVNLIPVKLLRSIPAKYDANGIARQVGECGMYDTVNDKFYGNVASSGTFSVEDDS